MIAVITVDGDERDVRALVGQMTAALTVIRHEGDGNPPLPTIDVRMEES